MFWFWLKFTIGFGETENIVNFDNYNNNNNVHSFDILNLSFDNDDKNCELGRLCLIFRDL